MVISYNILLSGGGYKYLVEGHNNHEFCNVIRRKCFFCVIICKNKWGGEPLPVSPHPLPSPPASITSPRSYIILGPSIVGHRPSSHIKWVGLGSGSRPSFVGSQTQFSWTQCFRPTQFRVNTHSLSVFSVFTNPYSPFTTINIGEHGICFFILENN